MIVINYTLIKQRTRLLNEYVSDSQNNTYTGDPVYIYQYRIL
jgi:hypothetical protein